MTKYFICDPENLCDGATCCGRVGTQPWLSLGDYIRLADYTNESVIDLWRTKGNLKLTVLPSLRTGEFLVSLSLLHNPCPYLTQEHKCSVYEVRPTECAGFPLFLYLHHPEQIGTFYQDYRCLKGVRPEPGQIELGKRLFEIQKEELLAEDKFLWTDTRYSIYTPTLSSCMQYVTQCISEQKVRAEREHIPDDRFNQLASALNAMFSQYQHLKTAGAKTMLMDNAYTERLGIIASFILEDLISERLRNLCSDAYGFYRGTTDRRKPIIEKIH